MDMNRINRYVNGILIKFDGKTTKHARVRPLGTTRVHVSKLHGHPAPTRYYWTKLAEALLRLNLQQALMFRIAGCSKNLLVWD